MPSLQPRRCCLANYLHPTRHGVSADANVMSEALQLRHQNHRISSLLNCGYRRYYLRHHPLGPRRKNRCRLDSMLYREEDEECYEALRACHYSTYEALRDT